MSQKNPAMPPKGESKVPTNYYYFNCEFSLSSSVVFILEAGLLYLTYLLRVFLFSRVQIELVIGHLPVNTGRRSSICSWVQDPVET